MWIPSIFCKFFNGKKYRNSRINPGEAVAIKAGSLDRRSQCNEKVPDVVLLDVLPLSLGIESSGEFMSVVVPRNTKIPCEIVQDNWTTSKDNQTSVRFSIYEGERPIASDNNLLGKFSFHGVRKAPKGEIKFTVTFKIDMKGNVNVTAVNKDNGDKGEVTITCDKLTLNKDKIESRIGEAKRMECEDEERLKALNSKQKLKELRNKIESAVNKVTEWLASHKEAPIHEYQQKKMALLCVLAVMVSSSAAVSLRNK